MIRKKSREIGVGIGSIENKKFWQNMQAGALIAATWLLFACGGGGDSVITSDSGTATGGESATVSALSMPDRITISAVDDGDGSSAAQAFSTGIKTIKLNSDGSVGGYAFDDAGTDYANQEKNVWVEDTDALDTVNDILSAVQESGYEHFVNEGPYKALVKQVGESEQSGGGSTTTSTTTEELMELTLDVTREDNESPMIIKVWVVEEDGPGGQGMLIRGYFTVTEGVSEEYPFGKMRADFVGTQLDANGQETTTEVMNIAISVDADDETGQVVIQCKEQGSGSEGPYGYESESRFRLMANADMSSGQAYVYMEETVSVNGVPIESESDEYEGYIAYDQDYFKVQTDGTDEVFDKNALHRKVYRYKLFDALTGDEVEHDGGFPITLENGEYGYISYWGLWTNEGAGVENGDTVSDMDGNEYTVFSVGGKLRKYTKNDVVLGDLVDVELSYWDNSEGGDLIIAWDGTAFVQIGYRNDEGQIVYGQGDAMTFDNEWDGAWCEALNASICVGCLYANGETPDNDTSVSYHSEQTIDPSTAGDLSGVTLIHLGPVVGQTQEEYWETYPPTAYELSFDPDSLVLYYGEEAQIDTTSGDSLYMGPLVTQAQYDALDNFWDIYSADEYYSWSTGPNQWEQFTTLKDADNQFVTLAPPLTFTYEHSTANDLNGDDAFDGKTFKLEYDGSDLCMPWIYDDELDEWLPMFSMKDGTELEDSDGNTYVVKGIEIGVVMRQADDPSLAASLVIDDTIEPPTISYDSTQTALVGAKPAAVLEVIKGELINE